MLKAPSLPRLKKHILHDEQAMSGAAGALPGTEEEGNLLPLAVKIMASAYAIGLFALAVLFFGHSEALFAVVIAAFYALLYFGMPVLMERQKAAHDPRGLYGRKPRGVSARIRVLTGTVNRREALLQMVLVPVLVAVFFLVFTVIWVTVSS